MSFDPFTAGFDLAKTVLNKFFPDAGESEKRKFEQAAREIEQEYSLILAQVKVNEEEAKSQSVFVAGARPAAMWVCVLTLAYSGIGVSFMGWVAMAFGLPPLPIVDSTTTNAILMGLLGLGSMRSFDKIKGVNTTAIGKAKK